MHLSKITHDNDLLPTFKEGADYSEICSDNIFSVHVFLKMSKDVNACLLRFLLCNNLILGISIVEIAKQPELQIGQVAQFPYYFLSLS